MSLSFSEEDFNDGCSSQDGSVTGQQQDFFSRRSRKLSGSRAWERANESDQGGECGYDVILMTEIPYSVTSLKKLYSLIKKVCFLILLSLVLDLVVVCFIVIVMVVVSLNSAWDRLTVWCIWRQRSSMWDSTVERDIWGAWWMRKLS